MGPGKHFFFLVPELISGRVCSLAGILGPKLPDTPVFYILVSIPHSICESLSFKNICQLMVPQILISFPIVFRVIQWELD